METKNIRETIEQLENMFDAFNTKFYNGKLTRPVITVSPDDRGNLLGWCTLNKVWKSGKDEHYEINICAESLNRPFFDICGTMLHEMVHLFNLYEGVQDCSRGNTYHNKKFKEVAEQHGLIIDKNPKYGWTDTSLTPETKLWIEEQWHDTNPFNMYRKGSLSGSLGKKSSSKKYVCPICHTIVRATKDVCIICGDCEIMFEVENNEDN